MTLDALEQAAREALLQSEPLTPELLVSRVWSDISHAMRKEGVKENRAWAHADAIAFPMRDDLAAIEASARKPLEERVRELEEALRGLREAANRYRQDVAAANEYLNQDLPSVTTLVWALGKASAALSDATAPEGE